MPKLISDNIDNKNLDFSYLKKNRFLTDPAQTKNMVINNARGSSYLEGINLPEAFFLVSYDLDASNN
jgi:hypothetical protein